MHDVKQIERGLKETVEGMSPEAREVWEKIERNEGRSEYTNEGMIESKAALLALTDPSDFDDVKTALALKAQLMDALTELE